ncbi:WhiB family transcriptional regulator [Kineosporiaceae bacterium SCSIO 59966]|nr:WhiB family transcriptional regulator [Kineosporiaceae bacterium SCSIO 59966]
MRTDQEPEPGDVRAGDTEPCDVEPGDTEPGDTEPGDVEPGDSEAGDVVGRSVGQWALLGSCRSSDPDALFVQGAAQNRAKAVCLGCPVRTECLADALDHRIEFGVWGGMTERERRALLKRRPNVRSWRRLLEAAREEHVRLGTSVSA